MAPFYLLKFGPLYQLTNNTQRDLSFRYFIVRCYPLTVLAVDNTFHQLQATRGVKIKTKDNCVAHLQPILRPLRYITIPTCYLDRGTQKKKKKKLLSKQKT